MKDALDLPGLVGPEIFTRSLDGQGLDELVIGTVSKSDGKKANTEFPTLRREAILEPLFLFPVAGVIAGIDDPVREEDNDLAGLLPAVASQFVQGAFDSGWAVVYRPW